MNERTLEEKRRTLIEKIASYTEEELEAFIAFAVAEWEGMHSSYKREAEQ